MKRLKLIPKYLKDYVLCFQLFLTISFLIFLLLGACKPSAPYEEIDGISIVIPSGSPPIDSIIWSPVEMNEILVTAGAIGPYDAEVYILNMETKKKEILAELEGGDLFGTSWSHDGQEVIIGAFNLTEDYDHKGIWILRIEDEYSEFFKDSGYAVWSPTGKYIATLAISSENDAREVYLYLTNIVSNTDELIYLNVEARHHFGISWSPDGQKLVFSLGDFEKSNIYIFDIKTREIIQITKNGRNYDPVWSPNGNLIAYQQDQIGEPESNLHLISSDGICDIEIPNIDYAWSPTWSPDGKKLAFVGLDGIYVLELKTVFGEAFLTEGLLCP